MPAVGSSSKTSLDCPHIAIATDNLRLLPPDRSLDIFFASGPRPVSLIKFAISYVLSFESPPLKS